MSDEVVPPIPERARTPEWELAVEFLRLTPTSRRDVADNMGVGGDLDALDTREQAMEILRRVKASGQVGRLHETIAAVRRG